MTLTVITHSQPALQAAFCAYVPQVFRRASFTRWRDLGHWADDYAAYAWIEDGVVLANASLTRMQLLVDGEQCRGWQLGAVGCVPAERGRGLARRCLDAALQACGDDPVLLFANPAVRAFYPRFGFTAREEQVFMVEHRIEPAGRMAPPVDLRSSGGQALLTSMAQHTTAVTQRLGAVDYGRISSWYPTNGLARPLLQLAPELLVFASVEDDTLVIDDILAPDVIDLAQWLPMLIDRPVRRIRFGFTPERWWPMARAIADDPHAHLFVRGFARLPERPHKFPVLAQT